MTSPLRTAWDLSRRLDRTEAVVAVDALARRGRFPPDRLLEVRAARPGARGAARLDQLVVLADPGAESPMETRLRLLLVDHGLPAPQVQYALRGPVRRTCWPGSTWPIRPLGSAIEYDGEETHRYRRRADNHRDIDVATELGWETMRFEDADVLVTPSRTAGTVARLLAVPLRRPR